jgi:hypothetical protein
MEARYIFFSQTAILLEIDGIEEMIHISRNESNGRGTLRRKHRNIAIKNKIKPHLLANDNDIE